MGKLPYGTPNRHIQTSKGGDSDLMKFYATQYATTYGKKFAKFEPRTTRHTGTGYLSNFRPGVYYTGRLDSLDNPTMGQIVGDNYATVTQKSFLPSQGPTGKEPLPGCLKQVDSGFVRQKPLTIPTMDDVHCVCIDTRVASAPADFMPRAKPHLHSILSKDTVEAENGGYGPGYMTTETSQRFQGQQHIRPSLQSKTVGPKEETGFTHAHNEEPVTFHADYAHQGDAPAWLTDRPIGPSIMKTDFRPSAYPRGDESLPKLANRSDRETGFTTGTKARPVFVNRVLSDAYDKASDVPPARLERTKKQDPTEYLNMTHPNNHSSIAKATFQGKKPAQSESDRLAKTAVGTKEPSGFVENNDRFIQTADNPARFVTHYQTRFLDRTPKGLDRGGHMWGGVQPHKPDGFTCSTNVHSYGADIDSTATIRNLHPYVARSVQARDTFYDDHTYDSKQTTSIHGTSQVC